jgi:hypothetical protein
MCGFRVWQLHPKGTSIKCLLIRGWVDPRARLERMMRKRLSVLGLTLVSACS